MVSRHSLFLFLLLVLLVPLVVAQKTASVQTVKAGGSSTTTFETPKGRIKVYLPDDMTAGDTISGTVVSEPSGKNEKEKQRNAGELQGYVIEFASQKSSISTGIIQRVQLAPANNAPSLILLDEKGKQVGITPIAVSTGPPKSRPSNFVVSGVGQSGRPIQVYGPFDGDSSNTNVKIGGSNATVVAESPRKLVVESPREVVGPTRIEVTENSATASGAFRNLKIDLTAPKTSLLKGESTELHVQVNGLEGITQPIPIQIQNQSPSTVNIAGGNTQTINIQPSQVQTGGTFPWTTGVTGTGNGGFVITGSLPSGVFFSPSPPSTTQPSPSPTPSSQSTDTVVSRPDAQNAGPGARDSSIQIEMVELSLGGSKPSSASSSTPVASEVTEPDVPKITEPKLRPPSLPSPTPEPEPEPPPRYVPAPAPGPPPETPPTIPGSGKQIVPKCSCALVEIQIDPADKEFKITPGDAVFGGVPRAQTGRKVKVNTPSFIHKMKCKGEPNAPPCLAEVSWNIDKVEVYFTTTGANWLPPGGLPPPAVPATTKDNIRIKEARKTSTLKGTCTNRKGGEPGCEVTEKYSLIQEYSIDYPGLLVAAIRAAKKKGAVIVGDIEITITMSVSVKGCKKDPTIDGGGATFNKKLTIQGWVEP